MGLNSGWSSTRITTETHNLPQKGNRFFKVIFCGFCDQKKYLTKMTKNGIWLFKKKYNMTFVLNQPKYLGMTCSEFIRMYNFQIKIFMISKQAAQFSNKLVL